LCQLAAGRRHAADAHRRRRLPGRAGRLGPRCGRGLCAVLLLAARGGDYGAGGPAAV
ncbi:hypothetical protein LPJ66_011511, partial [Kickxella alabastrina]